MDIWDFWLALKFKCGYWNTACVLSFPFFHHHTAIISKSVHITQWLLGSPLKQLLPTKMSYSANLKNVMSMEAGQRSIGNQSLAEQELEASKPGPSPHDLAAQLKSSLLAEIGLTESDGPPLPSFRYKSNLYFVVLVWLRWQLLDCKRMSKK